MSEIAKRNVRWLWYRCECQTVNKYKARPSELLLVHVFNICNFARHHWWLTNLRYPMPTKSLRFFRFLRIIYALVNIYLRNQGTQRSSLFSKWNESFQTHIVAWAIATWWFVENVTFSTWSDDIRIGLGHVGSSAYYASILMLVILYHCMSDSRYVTPIPPERQFKTFVTWHLKFELGFISLGLLNKIEN